MAAMTKLDLIVGSVWIGLLAAVLLVQAVMVGVRYRWARDRAHHAARLSRSLERAQRVESRAPRGAAEAQR
jgi:hypothetical protein